MESSKSRRERSVEMRDRDDSPVRERWEEDNDNLEENGAEKTRDSGKHRSKERSKSSRREEKERRSRDHERSKTGYVSKDREKDSMKDPVPSRDRRADDRDDRERDKGRRRLGKKMPIRRNTGVKSGRVIKSVKTEGEKKNVRGRETLRKTVKGNTRRRGGKRKAMTGVMMGKRAEKMRKTGKRKRTETDIKIERRKRRMTGIVEVHSRERREKIKLGRRGRLN